MTRTGSVLRALIALFALALSAPLMAQETGAGEANLKLPSLSTVNFLGGISGSSLLMGGMVVSFLGFIFGLIIYVRLRNMPVHDSMREVSELIYETCKTYLATQGKFLVLLECLIAVIIVFYFGLLQGFAAYKVAIILLFSVIGISGSFSVAAFGMRVNTFANSRTAFAALKGKAFPCYEIPLEAGMSIGMLLVSVELLIMLFILLFIPGDLAGACFIGFAIGESLGAAALRVAGGIFTKIADIGSDLMKIVFKIKEDASSGGNHPVRDLSDTAISVGDVPVASGVQSDIYRSFYGMRIESGKQN
jgi:K(+)-stimulated pyrophosphate-energized sodium pump